MRQSVKDFLNSKPRTVACDDLYKLTGGYAHEGGDYDAAQQWLAKNGYRYISASASWVHP